MTLLWFIVGASLVVALAAWSRARRTAKRLERLSEMYWELKYQHGELRVRMQRMTGEAPPPPPQAPAPGPPGEAFVPLNSLAPHRAGPGSPSRTPARWGGDVRGGDPAKH
ncbi:MAG: hypothetical protein HYX77_07770 [Acidobacteria bacterium]|nr:hypothetical protein [Acidobacteriota bacterium]